MSYQVPACIICFYPRSDGTLPSSLMCYTLEEAYAIVCLRDIEIECVMLQGDVLHRYMGFRCYESYLRRKNRFTHALARAIFHRIVGPYHARMRVRR